MIKTCKNLTNNTSTTVQDKPLYCKHLLPERQLKQQNFTVYTAGVQLMIVNDN